MIKYNTQNQGAEVELEDQEGTCNSFSPTLQVAKLIILNSNKKQMQERKRQTNKQSACNSFSSILHVVPYFKFPCKHFKIFHLNSQ